MSDVTLEQLINNAARGASTPTNIGALLAAQMPGQTGAMTGHQSTLREMLGNYIYDMATKAGMGKSAQGMRENAQTAADFVPGLGDAVGVDDTRNAFNAGNYGEAAVNGIATGVGMIPGGGDLAAGAMKAIFGGIAAKTADHAALKTAKELAEKGADKKAIWDATGWFKGADGKWRFEIDDSQSKLAPKAAEELMSGGGGTYGSTQRTAAGVLMHGPMFDAYPDLRRVDVDARYNTRLPNSKGGYQADFEGVNGNRPTIDIQSNSLEGDPRSVRGIGLHEFQHGVQDIEGFSTGGNNFSVFGHSDPKVRSAVQDEMNQLLRTLPKDEYEATLRQSWPEATASDIDESYKGYLKANKEARSNPYHPATKAAQETAAMNVYRRMSGETEARNVQTRMNMTPAERRAKAPWETQDVPDEQQIVRFR